MTSRITDRFAACAAENRPALVTFIMAGDPDLETAGRILAALPAAGADVIELGMPFSDPMADGPGIQAAGLRALHGGQTLNKTLAMVADFRKSDTKTPIVLMGYYNPIYIHGVTAFIADALAAGVDGLIVVDLPPEEDSELCVPALAAGLNFIRLTTPTTDDRRLPAVLKNTSGFVYSVSVAGITGAAMLLDRARFEQVDGFSTHYVIGDYEDSDLCLKLRAQGGEIGYEPRAELYHFERQSIREHAVHDRNLATAHNRRIHQSRWDQAIDRLMARPEFMPVPPGSTG